jgi:hypothetical protein
MWPHPRPEVCCLPHSRSCAMDRRRDRCRGRRGGYPMAVPVTAPTGVASQSRRGATASLRDEQLAQRVENIIAGLGLTHTGHSVAGGQIVHIPQVVSIDPGPPEGLDIQILPGQSPEDFSAHASAIAYDLGVAEVRVVPLGPSLIRLELLPHDSLPGHPPASR